MRISALTSCADQATRWNVPENDIDKAVKMARRKTDGRRLTILDIAREAGVSKSTVSLVLQGSHAIRPETRERVQQAIDRIGYIYHRGAANLRRQRSDMVGMVINDLTNPFFAELAAGIEHGLQRAGIVPFLANTSENPIRQVEVIRLMREHGAVGFILCPALGTDHGIMDEIEAWHLPIVTVMRRAPGSRSISVMPDNRRGALRAVQHLIRLGHRRIAFLGGRDGMVVHEERCAGYRGALDAAGLAHDPSLVVECAPSRQGGRDALTTVLATAEPPSAALCFNDVVAFGVLDCLAERGLTAGSDFAVVGFDDVEAAARAVPPLTTVRVDSHGLGEKAAQLLLQKIAAPSAAVPDFTGETLLVVRVSCGAPQRSGNQRDVA
jgi:LacI family transcriptional regulator